VTRMSFMVLSGGQSITQYTQYHVMLAVYGRSFLGLKIFCKVVMLLHLFFNCWLEWTRPQFFQAATASSEWSTFLADLSCRILISGSLSSNTHDFTLTETFNMFQLHKEGKIWEDKIKFIWQCVSLWTNESLFQYAKLISIPAAMRMFSYFFSITPFLFSKNKWLYSHKGLKWMGVVRVNKKCGHVETSWLKN